jgi:hypothetical protein
MSKRQIVMVTVDYRITIIDGHWTTRVEKKDGKDAMGVLRWSEVKPEEYQSVFFDFAGDVAVNLLQRKRRRNRK